MQSIDYEVGKKREKQRKETLKNKKHKMIGKCPNIFF